MKLHHISMVALLCLTACTTGRYLRTGPRLAERERCCGFTLVRSRVVEPYKEVGVVDFEAFSPKALPETENELIKLVAPHVCKSGGNAVIPAKNGRGRYVLATIVRLDSE